MLVFSILFLAFVVLMTAALAFPDKPVYRDRLNAERDYQMVRNALRNDRQLALEKLKGMDDESFRMFVFFVFERNGNKVKINRHSSRRWLDGKIMIGTKWCDVRCCRRAGEDCARGAMQFLDSCVKHKRNGLFVYEGKNELSKSIYVGRSFVKTFSTDDVLSMIF